MTSRPARGRRPGNPAITRQSILEAARATFARAGYERATIRAIASAAAVDPALVHHYFGTKEELFVAAHEIPISPAVGPGRPGRTARAPWENESPASI